MNSYQSSPVGTTLIPSQISISMSGISLSITPMHNLKVSAYG